MKKVLSATVALALCPFAAAAVGLDRSGQPIDILFEDGNVAQLSFGRVLPDVDGNDLAVFGGRGSGEVLDNFTTAGLAVKYQFDERVSFAVVIDEPYGLDIDYDEGESVALGGTRAEVDSGGVSALARYKFNDNFSVHGGLRYQYIGAYVRFGGLGFGELAGYEGNFDSDWDLGYIIGAAYERPDIALRVAVTYISETDHDLDTRETLNGIPVNLIDPRLSATSTTTVTAPEAIHLDIQSGIAPDTLAFANLRYARYEDTLVSPEFFDAALQPNVEGDSITDIETNTAITLGVARRFTERFAGSVSIGYEESKEDLVSPLSPVSGNRSIALGLSYDVTDAFNVSGGVQYTRLGDAMPETGTPDVARADFEDNDAVALGLQLTYRF